MTARAEKKNQKPKARSSADLWPPSFAKNEHLAHVPEVAKVLGVHRSSVYRLIELGKLPTLKVLGAVRVPWRGVRHFIDSATTAATT